MIIIPAAKQKSSHADNSCKTETGHIEGASDTMHAVITGISHISFAGKSAGMPIFSGCIVVKNKCEYTLNYTNCNQII